MVREQLIHRRIGIAGDASVVGSQREVAGTRVDVIYRDALPGPDHGMVIADRNRGVDALDEV